MTKGEIENLVYKWIEEGDAFTLTRLTQRAGHSEGADLKRNDIENALQRLRTKGKIMFVAPYWRTTSTSIVDLEIAKSGKQDDNVRNAEG